MNVLVNRGLELFILQKFQASGIAGFGGLNCLCQLT
jgi:hypothetical protein